MQALPEVALRLHARYAREQILVAFGATTFERQPPAREGVFVLKDQNIELMFVTLDKTKSSFRQPPCITITLLTNISFIGSRKIVHDPIRGVAWSTSSIKKRASDYFYLCVNKAKMNTVALWVCELW